MTQPHNYSNRFRTDTYKKTKCWVCVPTNSTHHNSSNSGINLDNRYIRCITVETGFLLSQIFTKITTKVNEIK